MFLEGKYDAAIEALNQALAIDPYFKTAQEYKAAVQRKWAQQ